MGGIFTILTRGMGEQLMYDRLTLSCRLGGVTHFAITVSPISAVNVTPI